MAAKKVSIKETPPAPAGKLPISLQPSQNGAPQGAGPPPTFEQMWFNDPVEGREAQKLALKLRENIVLYAETPRIYLERTGIIPMLLQGLHHMAKARPTDPAEWLAAFLLKNNPRRNMIITPPDLIDPNAPLEQKRKSAEVPPSKTD